MRRTMVVLGVLMVGLLLAGCGDEGDGTDDVSSDDSSTSDPTTTTGAASAASGGVDGKVFVSTSVSGGRSLVDGTEIRLEFTDGRVAARAGCNSMGGPVTTTADRLESSGDWESTLMACEPAVMAQDEWLAAFFASGPAWSLDGGTLELVGDDGVTITLTEETSEDRPLTEPTWGAVSIIDAESASSIGGSPPTFSFTDEGAVAVFDGCNRGTGTYVVEGDMIVLEGVASTDMACPDERAAAVVAELASGPITFSIDGDMLSLRTADDTGLDLRADR